MKYFFILLFIISLHLTSFGQNVIKLIPFVSYDKNIGNKTSEINEQVRITCDLSNKKFVVKSKSLNISYNYSKIAKVKDPISDFVYKFYVNNRAMISVSVGGITIVDNKNSKIEYYFGLGTHGYKEQEVDIWGEPITHEEDVDITSLYDALESLSETQSTATNSNNTSIKTKHSEANILKAVFHGTRAGKANHIKNDNRDLFDLFFQCNVTVYGTEDGEVVLTAYVDGETRGKGLYSPTAIHKTSEGNVAIAGAVKGRKDSNSNNWPTYTLTLPFYELGLPDGTHTINVRWFASYKEKFIGNSDFQTIHFTKVGKQINNFYVEGGEATPGF